MQSAEKRKTQRKTVRYPASLELGEGSEPIRCILCDASEGGSQVQLGKHIELPEEFVLALGGSVRRRCRVAWRNGERLGLVYIKTAAGPGLVPSPGGEPESKPQSDAKALPR